MKQLVILCLLSLMSFDGVVVAEEVVKKYPMPMEWQKPIDNVVQSLLSIIEPWKVQTSTYERGVPHVHQDLDCSIHQDDPQCLHDKLHNSPMVGAGHHVRAKTQNPVIGILTQPVPRKGQWHDEFLRTQDRVFKERQQMAQSSDNIIDPFPAKQFIEVSHVKFLESAGARVVPIDFTLDEETLKAKLKSINALYIPGNFKSLVSREDFPYTKQVQKILLWSQQFNEKPDQHFPIMGVGYGMLSLIKSQMYDDKMLSEMEPRDHVQINMVHEPQHTYIFDEYKQEQLDHVLDKIAVYSDLTLGLSMSDFVLREKTLGHVFIPVASFDDADKKSSNEEMVAVIEGMVYPWFGVGYRIDKIQFAFDDEAHQYIDQSRESIIHAMKISNLFIDEARLNGNQYEYVAHESEDINKIKDHDAQIISVPTVSSQANTHQTLLTEVYFF